MWTHLHLVPPPIYITVMIPRFWTEVLANRIRIYNVCHSVCTFWTHYSMVKEHVNNFRIITLMILIFRTDMPGQIVQTQIRSSLIRVYTVCHSVCIVWTHYSMVEPHNSNFRVITTNFLGVQILRKITVLQFFFFLFLQYSQLTPDCKLSSISISIWLYKSLSMSISIWSYYNYTLENLNVL